MTVGGTITFAVGEEGSALLNTATVSSSTNDPNSSNNSQSVSTSVVDPSVVASGGLTLRTVEGDGSSSQTLATFTDPAGPEALGDYTATIAWGDGSSSAGMITVGNGGTFIVSGSHTYVADGSYTASLTINHDSAAPVTVTDSVNVSDPPVVANSVAPLSATQNAAASFTLATFTDPGGAEALNNYSASVSWGDGTASAGTITFANGVFTVAASHTYLSSGTFPISVVITHGAAPSASVSDSVVVAPAGPGIVLTPAGTLSAVEGASAALTLATFTDAAPLPVTSYLVTINWGDGTTSTGTVQPGANVGSYVVTGNHKFVDEGSYQVTVSVSRGTGPAASVTDAANVSDPNVVATGGLSLQAQRGSDTTLTVATFTDPGGSESLGNYSATVNWGDGTTTAGTISFNVATSVFSVSGTHNYQNSGKFTLTVSIVHRSLTAVVVTDSLKVTGAPVTPPPPPATPLSVTLTTNPTSNWPQNLHGNSNNAPGQFISIVEKLLQNLKTVLSRKHH
jgi:hypothetical protein